MPGIPFQKDITNWYLNQDEEKKHAFFIDERMQCLEEYQQRSNLSRLHSSETQRYYVKYRSEDNKLGHMIEDALFLVPKAISRLFFPHISGDMQFPMSAMCLERMMSAIVNSSAEEFWTMTVIELIQMLRASRIPRGSNSECGAMMYVHDCVAKILNWRILQAYDVAAADDFMQVSFLLSAEDGVDIAWSQWNMDKPLESKKPVHLIEIFGSNHTVDEGNFQEKGIIITFRSEHDETKLFTIAVDVHIARLRSLFVQGLLSFPCDAETELPTIDLTKICTREAHEVFLKFFVYNSVPDCVSIECALQLWEVSEWMQVRKSANE
jgi:hypothetical protein